MDFTGLFRLSLKFVRPQKRSDNDLCRSITCQNDKTHACNSEALSEHYRCNLRYLSKDENENEFIWYCELNHIEF